MLHNGLPHAPPGSLEALRLTNRRRVVGVLRDLGTASRADIARRTGLSRSTVSSVVADLIGAGVVREGDALGHPTRRTGRPAVPLTLDESAGAAMGVDVAHDGIRVIVTDLAHTILGETWGTADVARMDREGVLALAAQAAQEALRSARVGTERLVGATVALPAPVDPDSGRVGGESVIASLAGETVGAALSARLGFPVRADNDANLCAVAEQMWGDARGHENAVFVKLSRGIGAGLLVGGRLYRGSHGGAGELGHTSVAPDGPVCRCGNRGCLEVMAGHDALVKAVATRFGHVPNIPEVVDHARRGDTLCRRALRDVGSLVGQALAGTVNLLNPSLVVVGGEMADAWPLMETAIRESMDRAAIHRSTADVLVTPSRLGRRAEALGAIGLVLRESVDLATVGA